MREMRIEMESCPECGHKYLPRVMKSAAGFYVGTSCTCGPFSRESEYYATEQAARDVLTLVQTGGRNG